LPVLSPLKSSSLLRAVVFDMDGVIVDSHPAHRSAWKQFLGTFGREVGDRELDFVMDGRKRDDILTHFLGPLTEAELNEYGRLKNEFFWQAASEVVPIPGVREFIDRLQSAGITMAVATSASASRTQSILRSMGLLARFRAIVTGDDVGKGKPDPRIYRLACERIKCPPSAAVAFEDAASGVRAAKGAGLKCIGIARCQSADRLTDAGADCVLPDFADITLHKFPFFLGMSLQGRDFSE
jgi:beta-phosphoglucomutase